MRARSLSGRALPTPPAEPSPTQGFQRSQVLGSVTDGFSSRCEPLIVLAAILGALRQEEFRGGVVSKDILLILIEIKVSGRLICY
jgi:hypothetical protein